MASTSFSRWRPCSHWIGRLLSVSHAIIFLHFTLIHDCSKVWDTHTGETLHTLQHNHIVRAVAFPSQASPNILATGGAEKKLRIFDITHTNLSPGASSNSEITHSNGGLPTPANYEVGEGVHQGTIKSIIWAQNDANVFVTAADDKKIRWWDLRSRTMTGEYEVDGIPGSCELSTTASTTGGAEGILSVAAGKSVYFFESAKKPGPPIKSIKLQQEAASVAINVAERKFVTGGGNDTWVRVYDLDSEEELEIGKGHHGPVWSVCFSPDGKLYATGSEDGTVKLWKFTEGQYGLWR